MKPTLQTKFIAGVAIAIALLVFGFCERHAGEEKGAIKQEIKASAGKVQDLKVEGVLVDADAKVEVKKSITKRAEFDTARSKVQVKGDSVFADGQRVDMPSVAAALTKADTMSVQDSTAIGKQARSDTLKTVLVGALDHHVDLLQEEKEPRIGLKTGIAIGVVGTAAVVIIAVKIIKALGHR